MKLTALIQALERDEEAVVITRNGRAAAVLISPQEHENWQETKTILSDADLMVEIQEGLDDLKRQDVPLYTLEELFDDAG